MERMRDEQLANISNAQVVVGERRRGRQRKELEIVDTERSERKIRRGKKRRRRNTSSASAYIGIAPINTTLISLGSMEI